MRQAVGARNKVAEIMLTEAKPLGFDGDVLVVCEVKTRKQSRHCGPLEAIDDDKLQRLRRLADLYVEATGIRPNGIRIDAVGVTHPRRGKAIVEHVAGVC